MMMIMMIRQGNRTTNNYLLRSKNNNKTLLVTSTASTTITTKTTKRSSSSSLLSFLSPTSNTTSISISRRTIFIHHAINNNKTLLLSSSSSSSSSGWEEKILQNQHNNISLIRRRSLIQQQHYSSSWSFPNNPLSPPTQNDVQANGLPFLRNVVSHADRPFLIQQQQVEEEEQEQSQQEKDNNENNNESSSSSKTKTTTTTLSYRSILENAASVATYIRQNNNNNTSSSSKSESIQFVAHSALPGSNYISCQWGIFATGMASVPISVNATLSEIEHILSDCNPTFILICEHVPNCLHIMQAAVNLDMLDRITYIPQILLDQTSSSTSTSSTIECLTDTTNLFHQHHPQSWQTIPALLLYTSGTTGKPKGVIIRHGNLYHQINDLITAWEWSSNDIALHLLPLHHVHGVVNILCCASYVGAQIQFNQPFNATKLWNSWAMIDDNDNDNNTVNNNNKPTVLMAVPTIYAKLLEAASKDVPNDIIKKAVNNTLKPMRLQISGSAALPVSIMESWENLTSHRLLERYGMTEFAMALSNPLQPMSQRQPGHVGLPLPSVNVRLVDEETGEIILLDDEKEKDNENGNGETTTTTMTPKGRSNVPGLLEVRGPTVFTEYLNRPIETSQSFTDDGYFKTGDVALYNNELNSYKILGRQSVDIIKTGGYKISALEIERVILEHPNIIEIAIVGIPDDIWGQRVGMIGRRRSNNEEEEEEMITLEQIQTWCSSRLSKYKIPTRLLWVSEIPKNAMGKVNKKDLVKLFDDNKNNNNDDGKGEEVESSSSSNEK